MTATRSASMARRWLGAAMIVGAAAVACGVPVVVAGASAGDLRAGSVTVVDGYNQTKVITHGSASTAFTVRLPDGAVCPGDSANDQWRVETFLIPSTEDPIGLFYGAIGPEPVGNGHYALFGVDTVPYVFQLTMRNAAKGQPGVIAPLPPFSFAVVAGDHIPDGRYRIGVACTYFGKTEKYWDTDVIISGSGVTKGKLDWRLADQPESVLHSAGNSGHRLVVAILLAVGALGAAGYVVLHMRSRHRDTRSPLITSLSKESP